MSQDRLTPEVVYRACEEAAQAAGRRPTLREVELRLATGSKTTIHKYWQIWLSERSAAAVPAPAPTEDDQRLLAELRKAAYEKALIEAHAAVAAELDLVRSEAAQAVQAAEARAEDALRQAAAETERADQAEARWRDAEAALQDHRREAERAGAAWADERAGKEQAIAALRQDLASAQDQVRLAHATIAAQAKALEIGQEQLRSQADDLSRASAELRALRERTEAFEAAVHDQELRLAKMQSGIGAGEQAVQASLRALRTVIRQEMPRWIRNLQAPFASGGHGGRSRT